MPLEPGSGSVSGSGEEAPAPLRPHQERAPLGLTPPGGHITDITWSQQRENVKLLNLVTGPSGGLCSVFGKIEL